MNKIVQNVGANKAVYGLVKMKIPGFLVYIISVVET